jgi:hypothetical protein
MWYATRFQIWVVGVETVPRLNGAFSGFLIKRFQVPQTFLHRFSGERGI